MFHQRVGYGPLDMLTCRHHWCSSNNSFICYKSGSRGRMLARVFPTIALGDVDNSEMGNGFKIG
ncbi:hypothetical protein ES319_D08G177400v1 [Gossypium barbadense]|uniref:Uncharacterized protein n=2 Tax=Gossypium TaxID=3633 RepID=A0A5J5QFU6_GOSBA|nr:hypothetical protein ES319_D08G177400v1 [Gossypium barbadense]TYG58012.1 hypothetical protein ES288_D08G188300v1 [Gossypium darwinii]